MHGATEERRGADADEHAGEPDLQNRMTGLVARQQGREQKTFSGSKLFYLNPDYTKILILSIPENMEGKLKMVIKAPEIRSISPFLVGL